ncbi:glutathionylspermidine synthase family protein [Azospirillum sp. sgz302134]
MKRMLSVPRSDWTAKAERVGFTYHSAGHLGDDGARWDESVAYEFTAEEVDRIESATNDLHAMCMEAVAHVVRTPDLWPRFGLPERAWPYIGASWARRDPHVYGRMDLAFDPEAGAVKLLEYNADTPTTLIESSVVQWFWLKDVYPDADQFNSIHERLIEQWRLIVPHIRPGALLHMAAWGGSEEDVRTTEYMMDIAHQAGATISYIDIERIAWSPERRRLVDQADREIAYLFKLYPWEWMITERFGPYLLNDAVGVVEPAWKVILSNKAILPVLWRLFPGHQHLLEACYDDERHDWSGDWVTKPIMGREGENIALSVGGNIVSTAGTYRAQPNIHQRAVRLPQLDGQYAVIGSWVVGDTACGMIVREDERPIITGNSRIVPHRLV